MEFTDDEMALWGLDQNDLNKIAYEELERERDEDR